MPIFYIPSRIEVGLDAPTRTLIERLIDVADQSRRIRELTARVEGASTALDKTVKANPDPDPTD